MIVKRKRAISIEGKLVITQLVAVILNRVVSR